MHKAFLPGQPEHEVAPGHVFPMLKLRSLFRRPAVEEGLNSLEPSIVERSAHLAQPVAKGPEGLRRPLGLVLCVRAQHIARVVPQEVGREPGAGSLERFGQHKLRRGAFLGVITQVQHLLELPVGVNFKRKKHRLPAEPP